MGWRDRAVPVTSGPTAAPDAAPEMVASHAPGSDVLAPVSRQPARVPGMPSLWDSGSAAVAATFPFTDREAVSPGLGDLITGQTGDSWPDRFRRAREFYGSRNGDVATAPAPADRPRPSAPAAGWRARAEPVEPPRDRDISMLETAAEHGANAAVLGAGPKMVGLYAAGEGTGAEHGSPLTTAADMIVGLWRKIGGDPEAARRYVEAKDAQKAELERTGKANRTTALLSTLFGGYGAARALGSLAPTVTGPGLLPRVATGALEGGTIGLGFGIGGGESAGDVAGSTLGGAAGGAALPLAAEGVRAGARAVANRVVRAMQVKPTPAAKALEAAGVTGLTAGQKAGPASIPGQLESVTAKIPMGLETERQAAKESFMRVAQDQGLAPGASKPATKDLQGRLRELFAGFAPVYDKIRAVPAKAGAVDEALTAMEMPGRGVDARTAEGVRTEVRNALTVLGPKPQAPAASGLLDARGNPIPAPPAPPMTGSVGDLLKVRENIREAIRAARQSQDFDKLRLLEGAEDVVTDAVERSLPADAAALLQQADRQYARLMTAANAAPSGQTTFTPLQYLKQVEKGAGRRAFKTGSAGDLQDLGEAARETFVDAPMTGWTTRVIDWIPGGVRATAPVARAVNWANSPAGQRFARSYPQSPAIKSRVPPDVAAFISSLGAPRPRASASLLPGIAEEEDPR